MGVFDRIILLVLVLCAAAWIDWMRARERATRLREYGFLLACAAVAGVLGAAVDQLSLAISPEYFIVGKGLARGASLRSEVTTLGFHAGFLAGAVGAGVLLLANNPRAGRTALTYSMLIRVARWPFLAALCLAAPGALWLDVGSGMESPPETIQRMFTVRGLHAGLYLGGALGLVLAVLSVRRRRRLHAGEDAVS